MKPGGQKKKGNEWERTVAKLLSDVFDEPFIRVPTSGAMTGGKNWKRKENMTAGQIKSFAGDIIPPDDYHVSIECKSSGLFTFKRMFHPNHALLEGWLQQTRHDAGNTFWLLCLQISGNGTYAVLPRTVETASLNLGHYFVHKDVYMTLLNPFLTNNRDALRDIFKKEKA